MKRIVAITIILLTVAATSNAMLAKYWRLRMQSGSAMETLTYDSGARISLRLSPWELVAGTLTYGTTITEDLGFGAGDSLAADGEIEGSVVDNTSNLYYGIKGYVEVTANLNPTAGVLRIFREDSDDNTNWPSDQTDFDCDEDLTCVCTLNLSTDDVNETRGTNFEF